MRMQQCSSTDAGSASISWRVISDTSGFERYRRATGWNSPAIPRLIWAALSAASARVPDNTARGTPIARPTPTLPASFSGGRGNASLLSEHLWKVVSAATDAFVTVDRIGTARAAAAFRPPRGITTLTRRPRSQAQRRDHFSGFIADLWSRKRREAWKDGDQLDLFPEGSYPQSGMRRAPRTGGDRYSWPVDLGFT